MNCSECNRDLTGLPFWREVTGFVKHRANGGTNHLALKRETGTFICESCMVLKKSGHQASLL